jgi:type 1 glutamine amidotransferase
LDLSKKGVNRTDKDFAVSWVRNYGKGRVFVSTLGHRSEVRELAPVQKMWLEAAKWVMGLTAGGEVAPR